MGQVAREFRARANAVLTAAFVETFPLEVGDKDSLIAVLAWTHDDLGQTLEVEPWFSYKDAPVAATESDWYQLTTQATSSGEVTHSPRVDKFTPKTGKLAGETSYYCISLPIADKHCKLEVRETGGGTLGDLEVYFVTKVVGD